MSDEQQRRGGAERGGPEPDETRPFDPAGTEQIQPDDGPRSGDAWILDHTEQMPRAEVGGDETVIAPRADATSVMPAVTGDPGRSEAAARAAAGQNDAWSGRAEVRSPRPGQGGDFTGEGWDGEPPGREPRGKWWLPIVIGIAVLVLLALLGVGVWLIAKNAGSDDSTPTPTSTATATTPPTTEATTTPPTTAPTTTTATTTEPAGPAEVTVPALKGLSSADARQALDRSGLAYRLRFVTSTDADPGTVIDCDPAEGEQVPSDTTVTLIIAAAPSTSPTVSTTPSTTAPTDTDNQPAGN